jgi:hypothetical protein
VILVFYSFGPFYKEHLNELKIINIISVIIFIGFSIISFLYTDLLELYSSDITRVNSPSEIINKTNNVFFSIDNYELNKNIFFSYSDLNYSEKGNDIYLTEYFVLPITDKKSANKNFQVWLGFKFRNKINNSVFTRGDVNDTLRLAHKLNTDEVSGFNYKGIKYFYNTGHTSDISFFKKFIVEKSNYKNNRTDYVVLIPSLIDLKERRTNAILYVLISIFIIQLLFIGSNYYLLGNS